MHLHSLHHQHSPSSHPALTTPSTFFQWLHMYTQHHRQHSFWHCIRTRCFIISVLLAPACCIIINVLSVTCRVQTASPSTFSQQPDCHVLHHQPSANNHTATSWIISILPTTTLPHTASSAFCQQPPPHIASSAFCQQPHQHTLRERGGIYIVGTLY